MKKMLGKIVFTGCLAAVTGFSIAQKVISEPNAQVRQVAAFNAVAVGGAIDLIISQGNTNTVVVTASDVKLRDRIVTSVEEGTLHISISGNYLNTNNRQWMRVYVSLPDLRKIGASGASDVLIEGIFKATNLEIALGGASDFKGRVEAERLKLAASGSSDIDISGKADRVEVALSGASDLNGRDLVARVCEIGASGSSDAQISVTEQMKASASGSCDIIYYGNPKVKDHAATRGASITQRN
ncbi:MAG: DUF2807 domain-containing protein [Chitinophagaceae bacterium]|jgi:hypothetical protein|nr:DUF2807 domain-containing protein [Chitinophagaceae bacterium]